MISFIPKDEAYTSTTLCYCFMHAVMRATRGEQLDPLNGIGPIQPCPDCEERDRMQAELEKIRVQRR